jgi:hypothetical protein
MPSERQKRILAALSPAAGKKSTVTTAPRPPPQTRKEQGAGAPDNLPTPAAVASRSDSSRRSVRVQLGEQQHSVEIGTASTVLHNTNPGATPQGAVGSTEQGTACDTPAAIANGRVATPVEEVDRFSGRDEIVAPQQKDFLKVYGDLWDHLQEICAKPNFIPGDLDTAMAGISQLDIILRFHPNGSIELHSLKVTKFGFDQNNIQVERLKSKANNPDKKIASEAKKDLDDLRKIFINYEQWIRDELTERLVDLGLDRFGISHPQRVKRLIYDREFKTVSGSVKEAREVVTQKRKKEITRIMEIQEQTGEKPEEPAELSIDKYEIAKEGDLRYYELKPDKTFEFKSHLFVIHNIGDDEITIHAFKKGEEKESPPKVITIKNEHLEQLSHPVKGTMKVLKAWLFKDEQSLFLKFALEGEEQIKVPSLTYSNEKAQGIGVALVSGAALFSAYVMDKIDQITLHFKPSGKPWLDSITDKINTFVDTVAAALNTSPTVSWKGFVWSAVIALWAVAIPKILIGARNRKKNHQEVSNNETNN